MEALLLLAGERMRLCDTGGGIGDHLVPHLAHSAWSDRSNWFKTRRAGPDLTPLCHRNKSRESHFGQQTGPTTVLALGGSCVQLLLQQVQITKTRFLMRLVSKLLLISMIFPSEILMRNPTSEPQVGQRRLIITGPPLRHLWKKR